MAAPAFPGDEPDAPEPRRALRRFYEQITLSPAHAAEMQRKRGLSPEIITRMGYRSSLRSNLAVLDALAGEFSGAALVRSGLYLRTTRGVCKPNRIYHGWGRIRKLPKSEQRDGREWEEGWCEPVLIPYFWNGELTGLRPHKDNVRGGTAALYVPPQADGSSGSKEMADGFPQRKAAIITEGEFKAAALAQVLGATHAVAALPGITMSKTDGITDALREFVKGIGASSVIVAFDNEDKATPAGGEAHPLFWWCHPWLGDRPRRPRTGLHADG